MSSQLSAVEFPFSQKIDSLEKDAAYKTIYSQGTYNRVVGEVLRTGEYAMIPEDPFKVPNTYGAGKLIDLYQIYPRQDHLDSLTKPYHVNVKRFLTQSYGSPDHPVNMIIRLNAKNDDNIKELTQQLTILQSRGIRLGNKSKYDIDEVVADYYYAMENAQNENDNLFLPLPTYLRGISRIAFISRDFRKQVWNKELDQVEASPIVKALRTRLSALRGFGYKLPEA